MKKAAPTLDVLIIIFLAGSILSGLLFANNIFSYGKYFMTVLFILSAYILPLYSIMRFLRNPKKYDRFAGILDTGVSSTTFSLGIISITFLLIACESDVSIIYLIISIILAIITARLARHYLKGQISKSHRQNFQLIIGIYVGFFIYPIIFLYHIITT